MLVGIIVSVVTGPLCGRSFIRLPRDLESLTDSVSFHMATRSKIHAVYYYLHVRTMGAA